jgi:hypothetical protein
MMLLAKIGTGFLGTALIAGGIVSSQGFVHVRVLEKQKDGTHLRLILPAVAVPIALEFVPGRHLEEAARNVRPWLGAINAATASLADCPDGTLVEVTEPGQHVSVVKSGGSIVVDVDDRHDTVHVSVPLATVRSAANLVADRGGAQ